MNRRAVLYEPYSEVGDFMTTGNSIIAGSRDERPVLASPKVVVQELERQGYVAEPDLSGSLGGVICRHPAAPSLLVRDDGRLELLSGQPDAQAFQRSQPPLKRVHWGRGLIFLTLLCATTFLGLLVVAMIVG